MCHFPCILYEHPYTTTQNVSRCGGGGGGGGVSACASESVGERVGGCGVSGCDELISV